MQFPVPSETFAAVEIRALQAHQVQVSVATFKPKPQNCDDTLSERRLDDIDIDHNSLISNLRGLWVGVRKPSLPLRLLKSLSQNGTTIVSLLKSLLLIPRALDLFNRIQRSPPDVVHLYWGHYPSLLGLLIHYLLRNIPVSLSLSAYDLHHRYGPSIELGKAAPLILTLAKANVVELRRLGFDDRRVRVIYHGVDIDKQAIPKTIKHSVEVIVAERLIPLKRTADSLRVFRKVLDERPDATLTLMGDGPDKDQLVALVEELKLGAAVRLTGHVGHEQVFKGFDSAKVMLSMSTSERLPNTVKEAMLRDCIPVVARTVGIEELIDHGATGFIVEQGEIDSAARAVLTCLNEWDSLEGLRTSAREHITSNFDSLVLADRRIQLWRETLDARNDSLMQQSKDATAAQ